MAGGGAMGKGGGRPGGRPGMGGKGGGMRPANPPRLPSVIGGGFTPQPPPAPGQQVPSNLLSTMPQLGMGGVQQQQMAAENQLAQQAQQQQQLMQSMLNQATGQYGAQPTSAGGAMSMLNQAIGGSQQPISPLGSQELMNAARSQFGVARRQPPRMMPGGGGRQFDPAPAPQRQPGLFNYLDLLSGG